jgi:hypothetical protein
MNQSLEIAVINKFVVKNKQSKYTQFISSEKTRSKFISDLPHFNDFKWELLDEVQKNEAAEIQSRLKELGIITKDCYVISENRDIDGKVIPFDQALEKIGSMATILVFGDAKLIYFEGEPPKNRYISKSR